MIPSTQYVSEGTEYNSNISSDVTTRLHKSNYHWKYVAHSQARECSGLQRRSVMSTGWSTVGVSMPRLIKA